MVTHDPAVADQADRVIHLANGLISGSETNRVEPIKPRRVADGVDFELSLSAPCPSPCELKMFELLSGFTVRLGLTDLSQKIVDFAPYLRGPIFESIRND